MSIFDRNLSGFRFVEIAVDDTMQSIAARELGDASRWVDIVNINGLSPPYLTGDSSLASAKVKLYGQTIIVPAAVSQVLAADNPDAVFGADLALPAGRLTVVNGDFGLISGRQNLDQALKNAIETETEELLFHPTYGCLARTLVGAVNGPTKGLLAASAVKSTLLADKRVDSVSSSKAVVSGDVISVAATAVSVSGTSTDITASP